MIAKQRGTFGGVALGVERGIGWQLEEVVRIDEHGLKGDSDASTQRAGTRARGACYENSRRHRC